MTGSQRPPDETEPPDGDDQVPVNTRSAVEEGQATTGKPGAPKAETAAGISAAEGNAASGSAVPPADPLTAAEPSTTDHRHRADGPAEAKRKAFVFHALISALCLLLGFAFIVQVRRTQDGDTLTSARPVDLVAILDDLQQREDSLTGEIDELREALATLRRSGADSAQALAEARRRATTLGILAGTLPATGPGVVLTVADPDAGVGPDVLLGALQELRNAGAEAVDINGVRIAVNSAFTGSPGEVVLDGIGVSAPYLVTAIGDPPTLDAAMNIPGGVSDTVRRAGATLQVTQRDSVTIDSLRAVQTPNYARPAGD